MALTGAIAHMLANGINLRQFDLRQLVRQSQFIVVLLRDSRRSVGSGTLAATAKVS